MLLSKTVLSKSTLGYTLLSREKLSNYGLLGPQYGIGGIDEYTKLMLHMNGTNGSTTFTDSSIFPKTVTAYGNTQISTAQSKFGGASAYFDGNGDYLTVPNSSDFIIDTDYTIDAWIYIPNTTGDKTIIAKYSNGVFSTDGSWAFWINGNKLRMSWIINSTTDTPFISNGTIPINTWVHVAFVRSGNTAMLFINGNLDATYTSIPNNLELCPGNKIYIGRMANTTEYNPFVGYIDELRVSKGIARWTSNFTPPTQEYTT